MSETLRSLGSNLSKLRTLVNETKKDLHRIRSLQNDLTEVLSTLWSNPDVDVLSKSQSAWGEFVSLIAAGRILSVAAQAEEALTALPEVREHSWISSGPKYARWLGRGIAELASRVDNENDDEAIWKTHSHLCGKALTLGYPNDVVEELTVALLMAESSRILQYQSLVRRLSRQEQRLFTLSTVNFVSNQYLFSSERDTIKNSNVVSACAALFKTLIEAASSAKDTFFDCLTRSPSYSSSTYRAMLASLSQDELQRILERNWHQFGDKLYIKHTPIVQQESMAQILLLAAGYVHRSQPMQVFVLARSSIHTGCVSERLGSTSNKIRFLGMVSARAISQLVDTPENKVNFEFEEMEKQEAQWYEELVNVNDKVGSIQDLRAETKTLKPAIKTMSQPKQPKAKFSQIKEQPKSKIIEVVDDDEEEDDLIPYAKPDSDPEDEDEDPTLVQRSKPKAPVYIRELVAGLQDMENYDQHQLSVATAASLIRRKADFGSELKDRCEELGNVLVSLQDKFEMENWHEMRLNAMIAVLVAQPQLMGPWFARTFFSGDYSLSQRASILTTLGLGARELAGFTEKSKEESFPSKKLPERLHRLYMESSEMNALAQRLENTMLEPVTTKKRKKVIRNDLAKMVAECFFFPLTGYSQHSGISQAAQDNPYLSPQLLPVYLKTIAVIVTSAGPSTIALEQMTSEFWDMLMSLRSTSLNQGTATLEALLFCFMTVINVNEDKRRLAQIHSKELLETHEWVQMVWERISGGDEEGQRCKTLAAGVLVGTKEVVETYNRLMMGNMIDM